MSVPDPTAAMPRTVGRRWSWLIAWAGLTLYLLTPPTEAMNPGLDSSNYGSYAWLTSHGKQHGIETIAMTGPLGFLAYGTTYSGELFAAHRLGDLLLKAVFAGLALLLAAQARGPRRWLWLTSLVIFLPNVGDLFYDFAILTASLWLLTGPRRARPDPAALLAAGLLGFMALMKGTNALVTGAALAGVLTQSLLERRPGRALNLALAALGVFLTGWLATRQPVTHLPAYFRGVWELATGYNDVMGLASRRRELAAGLLLAGGLLLLGGIVAWSARRDLPRLLTALFLAGFTFLKWKHGFLRADGHVFIFFNYAVPALGAIWLIAPAGSIQPALGVARLATLGVLALGSVAASEFRWARFGAMFTDAPARLRGNFDWLRSPAPIRAAREAELARNRTVADLPQIRAEVEDRSIDFFGYEQGVLLLNRFNYQPRPMGGGSFNVFTRYLQRKNDAFIRDASRRPEFQLVKIQTLDGRLPAADDPLTLTALLHLYTPVRAQRDYLLFQQRPGAEAPRPRVLSTVTTRAGEAIAVPAATGRDLVLFHVDARYTLVGRLRRALYRPPQLNIALVTGKSTRVSTFRLAPAMATVPVLLSPLVESNRDLLTLYGAGTPTQVTRLIFRPEPGFVDEFKITFYTLPAPPTPPDDLAGELLTYLQHPLANRTPLEITTEQTGIHELYDEPLTLVHAPGRLVFPRQAGDQQVIFNFGLMPQAYDPGRTKGVAFLVEVLESDDTPATVLFSRYLDPVARPADRGMQWARVFLPPGIAAGRLRLRTAPGPTGDAAWAQSYFTHVQIKSGPLDPRQFSGFSVAPLPPGFESQAEHDAYGRKVRAFHPPSSLTFPVPADATTVTLAVGLQAVAYEGENQTDGVEFFVTLASPGQPDRLLSRRLIHPLRHVRDRGTQIHVVDLPAGRAADSRLIVRAGPGPANDDRWDWAYLQTVHFR
jgi:hypothetical protein